MERPRCAFCPPRPTPEADLPVTQEAADGVQRVKSHIEARQARTYFGLDENIGYEIANMLEHAKLLDEQMAAHRAEHPDAEPIPPPAPDPIAVAYRDRMARYADDAADCAATPLTPLGTAAVADVAAVTEGIGA